MGRNEPQPPGSGLSGLEGVPLGFNRERFLEAAVAGSGGCWITGTGMNNQNFIRFSDIVALQYFFCPLFGLIFYGNGLV